MRARLRDVGPGRNGVAGGVGERDRGLVSTVPGEVGHHVDRIAERAAAVVRDVHPDLARAVEVVVGEHDRGGVGRPSRRDVGGSPLPVDPERRATRAADVAAEDDVGRVCPVDPRLPVVERLPDVGLQRCCRLATGEVALVDRIRLVGEDAVVAA